jgi:hypothetical protein
MCQAFAASTGWSESQIALFDAGFRRYWERSASLARRTAGWPRRGGATSWW